MTQTCFGPTGKHGRYDPQGPSLTNESAAFLRKWGIVSLDFESEEAKWAHHSPKDADVTMLAQLDRLKAIAPHTRFWIYRQLVQAYSNFVEIREKLEDPQFSGWFLKFGPHNNESLTPRCAYNPRVGRQLCSNLFHTSLAWTENGHDCGDVIPCGDYVFDHRNQSLREWLVRTHILGPRGMAHPAVDGFLIDDWWTAPPAAGPSEVPHFVQGTGITPTSAAAAALYGNWSVTTWAALAAVRAAGGFSWSNVNCMLDWNPKGFDSAAESNLSPCGLFKTEGQPRANNVRSAPLWDGPASQRHWPDAHPNSKEPAACATWLREACAPSSVFQDIPTMLGLAAPYGGGPPFFSLSQDVARFLLVRGNYSWLGYGWKGCITSPPPIEAYDADYGVPLERCRETAPWSGVFTRRWSKGRVQMDCNTFTPRISVTATTDGRQHEVRIA